MVDFDSIFDLILDNFRKIFYPEEWLATDLALSRTELLLVILLDRRGEMTMSELASELNVALSTMTGLADKLVKGGYLARSRSDSDRRVVTVGLTESGREVAASLKKTAFEYLKIIDETLSPAEKETLQQIYHKVKTVLDSKAKVINRNEPQPALLKRITID